MEARTGQSLFGSFSRRLSIRRREGLGRVEGCYNRTCGSSVQREVANSKRSWKGEEKALRFVCRWSKVRQRLNVLTSASRKTVAREQRVIPSSHPVGRRSRGVVVGLAKVPRS